MRNSIKKITAVLLALLVMIPVGMFGASAADAVTTAAPVYTATPNWGANAEGVFEIATPGDLYALAANRTANGNYAKKTIVLTADIDLNPGWDAKTKTAATNMWQSMFSIDGTIDGQGHTIRGLCVMSDGDNGTFISVATGVIKNLRIENSYFYAKNNGAGFVSAIKGSGAKFENVYIDSIVEAGKNAGGFAAWFNCTAAWTPKVVFTNCIFAGTVTGGTSAAGFVGTNDHPTNNTTSKGTYDCVFTNCANYGTVTCADPTKAGGFVGNCTGGATLTSCYNAGDVGTAFVNIGQATLENLEKTTVAVTLNDCYYDAAKSVKSVTKTYDPTTLTINYDGQAANTAKTATVDEVLATAAFKASDASAGWAKDSALNIAVPMGIACLFGGHEYESKVVAPTCSEQGYTDKVCKKCGDSTKSNFVDTIEHTPSNEWIVDKEPTEEFAGSRHQECTVCHKTVKTEILPKLEAESDTETDAETGAGSDSAVESTPDSADNTTPDTDAAKGGCGSAIGASVALVATLVLGTAVVSKKRR